MKHTNVYQKYKALEEQERQELIRAVLAHGGEYVFIAEDDDDYMEREGIPVVMASHKYCDTNADYYVSRVTVTDGKYLTIYGFKTEYDFPSDEDVLYYIEFGHLDSIISAIPETAEVSDVTIEQEPTLMEAPILILSRGDITALGYDAEMTDDKFQSLAWKVAKCYENDMETFWLALENACIEMGLTKINQPDETE